MKNLNIAVNIPYYNKFNNACAYSTNIRLDYLSRNSTCTNKISTGPISEVMEDSIAMIL